MPAVGGHNVLHTAVVPVLFGNLLTVNEEAVAVAHAEIGDEGDLGNGSPLDGVGGDTLPIQIAGCGGHEGVALCVDPQTVFLLLVIGEEIVGGKIGPAGAVEAQGGVGSLPLGSEQIPVHKGVIAVGLDIDTGVQVIGVHAQLGSLFVGGFQQGRFIECGKALLVVLALLVAQVGQPLLGHFLLGPPEVQEHAVGNGLAVIADDEKLVLIGQGVLPVHLAVHGHGVIPHDLQSVAGLGLEGFDEFLHKRRVLGSQGTVGVALAAFGLLVDEPAVEAEIFRDLNELVDHGEIAAGVLLQEVVQPLDLSAVSGLGEEHGAEHRDAVPVGSVDDIGAGGHDQALAGGAAPVYQLVNVLPVGEHIGVGGVDAMGRVSAGAGVHDGNRDHIQILVLGGVGRRKGALVHTLRQGDAAYIVNGVGILGGVPIQQVIGEPVGNLRKIGQGLIIGAFFRNGEGRLLGDIHRLRGSRLAGGSGGIGGGSGVAPDQSGDHCHDQNQR